MTELTGMTAKQKIEFARKTIEGLSEEEKKDPGMQELLNWYKKYLDKKEN